MKYAALILLLAASTIAASAQTPAKPASAAKPATIAAKPAAVKPAAAAEKLPPGVPVVKTVKKTLFSLRYQEIKIGTGAEAEPTKLYKVLYTGRFGVNGRADDWKKFDSTDDHPRQPVLDKDGKPVLGDDGKPKQGPPQPISFPQGYGRAIPGFDQGFAGMKVGGQRRIFIPWQLAYGAKGRPGPDAAHPGIPEKSDLIFDVELVDVSDIVMPPGHPGMTPGMHTMPGGAPHPPMPTAPAAPPKPPAPATAPTAPTPNAAPAAAPTVPAAAPATPAAPATAPAPAAPATPPQPQAK
ncbi:MAG TPA: FKBP-type peptidyl-prolyl cis-trans isomerase [Terracidiphilus sp.]|jgi:peptidylprolyl isomerase|nr:FKBP-type peptidyl-prolyl cis-trans isomerase [Terracidiphilus sp.]